MQFSTSDFYNLLLCITYGYYQKTFSETIFFNLDINNMCGLKRKLKNQKIAYRMVIQKRNNWPTLVLSPNGCDLIFQICSIPHLVQNQIL
jgi:hypothetical protein